MMKTYYDSFSSFVSYMQSADATERRSPHSHVSLELLCVLFQFTCLYHCLSRSQESWHLWPQVKNLH